MINFTGMDESSNTVLSVKDLSVTLSQNKILENVTFEVCPKEIVAIIGPNGAGKTVLFRTLLGLNEYKGEIKWREGVKIGYVPQRMSVESDLPLSVGDFFSLKEKNRKKVLDSLELVSLEPKILSKRMGVLSGGQLQRVLIAWALLGEPDILLFDEPTSGIDIVGEESIYGILKKIEEQKGLAVVLISHEMHIVYKFAQKVVCLNKGQLCYGPPREVLDKESLEKIFGSESGVYEHHHHNH